MELESGISNDCNNFTAARKLDPEYVDVGVLDEYECNVMTMQRRFNATWLQSKSVNMRRIQPYYFLHIHKAAGLSVVKELEVLLKDEYWCQSERPYADIVNDKTLFPYKKPMVITFLRQPVEQFISNYRYKQDMYLYLGYTLEELWARNKTGVLSGIDSCVRNQACVSNYANLESKVIGHVDVSKFWFVGITEYFYSSLCMLKYKLGKYDREECDCDKRDAKKLRHDDHHSSNSLSIHSLSNSTLDIIRSYSSNDMRLYNTGLRYFNFELQSTRALSGNDFKCGSIPLKVQ